MNTALSLENSENIDQVLHENLTEEEKNKLMFQYLRDFRINTKTEAFERLLRCGVSANLSNAQGKSLLMIAAEKGSIELVQELLEARADVRMRDRQGKTALYYAIEAAHENLDVISLLLDYNSDPNAETNEGKTPLLRAIEKDYFETTKILLEKGGYVNSQMQNTGDTTLHLAVKKGNKDIVNLLIQYQCDLQKENKRKETALDLCKENTEIAQIMQSMFPMPKMPEPHFDAQTAIKEFMQIKEKSEHEPEAVIEQEKINEGAKDERAHIQALNQDQTGSNSKPQQKQPQDYRRHQQQQLNQKKSQYQKSDKEPPVRKYASKGETLAIKRTQSNIESSQKDILSSDSNINLSPISSNKGNSTINNKNNVLLMNQNSTSKSNPQNTGGNQEYNFQMNAQSPLDETSNRQSPLHSNKPGEYRKSFEENNQFLPNQKQMQRINMAGTSELSSPQTNAERFADKEAVIQHGKGSPSDYPPQFQHHQNQPQIGPSNIQGKQGGFNPAQQMKGNNLSPGYYTNPQFFPNNQSPGQPQNFQKRKQKGMMNNNPNTTNNNPNNQNKNFGMNPFPMNQSSSQPVPQNINTNQFRGNMESNKFMPDQNNNQRGPNNQQNNNKFNRNQERNFQENSGMSQRGFIGPSGYQQHGGVINIPENINTLNEANIEKAPGNVRNFDENKNIKGRPQQQQGNFMFKNNPNNMMFPPGSQFMDARAITNNMPGQNPGIFSPPFHQQQPQSMAINMGNIGPNMGQHTFMTPFSPNMTPTRGQQGMNPMMSKSHMQPFITYPGGIQRNVPMGPNHPVLHYNLEDPLQNENNKVNADVYSIINGIGNQVKELNKIRTENDGLKVNLNEIKQNEKTLQDQIKDKEKLIEELKRKNEDLELAIKAASAKSPFINRQDKALVTDSLLTNFSSVSIERILQGDDLNVDFWKQEALVNALKGEVAAFEKVVDEFNIEKKSLFDSLIKMMQQAVLEVVSDSEFCIYGSFATGLSLPWSDIDIVIKLPLGYYNYSVLDLIEGNLKKKKWVEDIKIIKNASVPVLKITCTKNFYNKKIDISIQDQKHNGLACVELVKEFLSVYPALRPLVLILKHFLYRLNLNDTYIGGLSSYGLILMIVYLFQIKEIQNSQNPIENQNLGSLLLAFFHLYGFEYDYFQNFLVNPKRVNRGTDINRPSYSTYAESMSIMNLWNQNPPSIMEPKIIIQDPLSTGNNVGRSTFQIKHIKNSFMAAYFEAYKPCICEIHSYVGNIGNTEPENKISSNKCASVFGRMLLSYQPLK